MLSLSHMVAISGSSVGPGLGNVVRGTCCEGADERQ